MGAEKQAGPPVIIHGGPWRTGSGSMAAAYRILGFRAHHTNERFNDFRMFALLELAAEGKWPHVPGARPRQKFTRADWDELFGEWDVITDGGADYVLDLAAAYPDARVVVVQRDFEKWWASYQTECIDALFGSMNAVSAAIITNLTEFRGITGMQKTVLGAFGARNGKEVRERGREYYDRFYEELRREIPPERRLEYKLGSGWKPLCEFLGKPVPDVPFPHVNEAQAHQDNGKVFVQELLLRAWRNVMPWLLGTVSVSVLAVGVWIVRS